MSLSPQDFERLFIIATDWRALGIAAQALEHVYSKDNREKLQTIGRLLSEVAGSAVIELPLKDKLQS